MVHESPETILKFISCFHGAEVPFTTDCCYWFAYILQGRFPYAKLVYLPVTGHFVSQIDDRLYDVTGDVTEEFVDELQVPWVEVAMYDRNVMNAVTRDVILKLGE